LKVSFLVIPDKSTAYANEIIPKDLLPKNNFWSEIQTSANFVSLLDEFQEAAATIVDFYLPNDTHLSTSGYQYLAEHLYNTTLKDIDISD
jgi:lysophospholipase L1-like esterase